MGFDESVARRISAPGVDDVDVTPLCNTPWTAQRTSETARLQLGLL
jgi:hypothetical protein